MSGNLYQLKMGRGDNGFIWGEVEKECVPLSQVMKLRLVFASNRVGVSVGIASSRRSVSCCTAPKTAREKIKHKTKKRGERIQKNAYGQTYPLIGQFWQILSTFEHYWRRWDMRYGGGQRPFKEWRGVQIFDLPAIQHAKRFSSSGTSAYAKNRRIA